MTNAPDFAGKRGTVGNRLGVMVDFSAIDHMLTRPIVWAGAIMVVALLQTWLIVSHAPWLDEWQALQIAVQSPSLHDLFVNLSYEGHPAAWYVLLRGIAAVLPDTAMALPVAALLLALVSQSAILFTSPFSRTERLLLSLSQFVLFEFLSVSRSLTLGATMVLVFAALSRHRRLPWLAIGVLPQCDILLGVLAVALCFVRWREKRLWWPGVVLFVASGLCAAWTVRPAPDMVPALQALPLANGIAAWVGHAATIGIPLQWRGGAPAWNSTVPILLLIPASVLFYALVKTEILPFRNHAIALLGFTFLTFLFSVAVYPLTLRHLSTIALLLVALVWMRREGNPSRGGPVFHLWLVLAALCGMVTIAVLAVTPFDTASLAAAEIRNRGLVHKQWFSIPDSRGQGVAAINDMVFQPIGRDCVEDFIRWNFGGDLNATTIRDQLRAFADTRGRYYILSDIPVERIAPFAHRFASIPAGYDGFGFSLYVVAPDRPDAVPTSKRCNGPVRPLRRN